MDLNINIFTTNRHEGWIEVIRKGEKEERMSSKLEKCISITATGWANISKYVSPD